MEVPLFVEQTSQISDPKSVWADRDGYVTIVERWEPARKGETSHAVFFDQITGESVAMKMVSRTPKCS